MGGCDNCCEHADTEARDEAVTQAVEHASVEAQDAVEDLVEAQLTAAAAPGLSGHERAEVLAERAGRFRREGRVAVGPKSVTAFEWNVSCR